MVTEISQPEDFATIPGVQETKMLYQIGDLIDERPATGSLAAYVYFTAQDENELNSITEKISARYHIKTEVLVGGRKR